MKARFLEDVIVNDIEKEMRMTIGKGEILTAIDRDDYYELHKTNGWGTTAPKECEGTIYEILKE